MALLYFLLVLALTWGLGALQLWAPTRWMREVPLWLGVALAVGAAACVAWGFAGIFLRGDWQSLTMDQAMHRVFGPGSAWFLRSGWALLDRAANIYVTLDLLFNLVVLAAVSMHAYLFWSGLADRRRRTRARSSTGSGRGYRSA